MSNSDGSPHPVHTPGEIRDREALERSLTGLKNELELADATYWRSLYLTVGNTTALAASLKHVNPLRSLAYKWTRSTAIRRMLHPYTLLGVTAAVVSLSNLPRDAAPFMEARTRSAALTQQISVITSLISKHDSPEC